MNNKSKTERLDYIDSLRGIAIIMVIGIHTLQSIWGITGFTAVFLRFGQMGVQLFFIMSALTLCMSLDRPTIDYNEIRNFYIRRFFRIAPLYYVGIVFYFFYHAFNNYLEAGHFIADKQYIFSNILSNFLFCHGFVPEANNTIVPGGWSIGTEMAFYVLFPFLFIFYLKSQKRNVVFYPLIMLFISMAGVFLLSQGLNLSTDNNSFLYYNLINLFPVFTLGISYFFILKHKQQSYLIVNKRLLLILIPVLLLLSVISFMYYFKITWTPFLCGLCFVLLIDLFKHYQALNHKLLVRIGQLSFSMYIFHFVFAWPVARIINKILYNHVTPGVTFGIALLIAVIGTFFVAMVSEKIIEKPGIRLGKQLIQRMSNPS